MKALRLAAAASLAALIVLCLAWELWLAPLRPGGSLVALKALPLVAPLSGILAGRRTTYQWSCLLILAYFAEGATRACYTGPAATEPTSPPIAPAPSTSPSVPGRMCSSRVT